MPSLPVIVCEEEEDSSSIVTVSYENVPILDRDSLQLECHAQWNALVDKEHRKCYQIHHHANHPLEESRAKLCDWSYQLVDTFKIDRSIVSFAFTYYDRYLSREKVNCIDIVFISSIYLAIKLHSCSGRTVSAVMMSEITGGSYTEDEIVGMEINLLTVLEWEVHPPVPVLFLFVCIEICKTLSAEESALVNKVLPMAKFLIELTVYDSKLSSEKPSSIAFAATSVAAGIHSLPSNVLEKIMKLDTTSQPGHIEQCRDSLQLMYNHWMFSKGTDRKIGCDSPRDVLRTEEIAQEKRDGQRLDPVFKSAEVRSGRGETRTTNKTGTPSTV